MSSDLTIDILVRKMLSLIDESSKVAFMADRMNRESVSKNVECFYLSDLCSEFKIFSELDLLLISFGCEVSIWVDIAVPFITTRLPNKWEQHVVISLGQDGDISITCKDPLKYTAGKLPDVCNFIAESTIPDSVSFPKRPSREIEEESNLVEEEKHRIYKGGINYSYDIDGICGFVPETIPSPFKTNINIEVDIKNNPQIFTKKLVHKHLAIKEYTNIKLGSLDTRWGAVSLFIVFAEREGGNYLDLFLKNIAILLEGPSSENSEIKGVVESHDVPIFLEQLRNIYPGSSIFLEIYGCKNAFSNKFFAAVFTKLFEIFDVCLVPELTYDIALRAVPQLFKCLFLSNYTFNRLHVRPNYKLAFCNSMANHNEVKIRADGHNTFYSYGCIGKINFYSLLEDMIESLRKCSFLPVVSLKLAQQDLEGLKYKKGTVNCYGTKIDTIKRNMENVSRLGYRFELTTKGRYLSTVHNVLHAVYQQSEFICFDYRRFKYIFLSNLYYINSLIGGNTISDLFNNISAETILKEAYLKGSVNKHFLPESYNIKQFFSNRGIRRLNDSFKTAISIERNEGVKMLHKVVLNASLKCLKEGFVELLKTYLFVMEANTPETCIIKVIEQYNKDYTHYYNLEDIVKLNYNELGPYVVLLKDESNTISLSYFLQANFLGERPRKANMPYLYLFDFIKERFTLSQDVLLDICYTIWKHHGLNIGWVHLNHPEAGSKLLILLSLDVISIGGHNKGIWLEKLDQGTNIFLAQQGIESLRPKRVKWTELEHIRLLNGLMRYHSLSSKFTLIYNDFVYGFYLNRPAKNALFDGFRTLLKKPNLLVLVEKAIRWKPIDYKLHHEGLVLSDEMEVSYKHLYLLDESRYRPVSKDGLKSFTVENLQISDQQYNELEETISPHSDSMGENEFRSARWKSFDVMEDMIYIWENRPILDSIPEYLAPTLHTPISQPTEPPIPSYVTMDHINDLKKEILELREYTRRLEEERLLDRKYLEKIEAHYLGLEDLGEVLEQTNLQSNFQDVYSPETDFDPIDLPESNLYTHLTSFDQTDLPDDTASHFTPENDLDSIDLPDETASLYNHEIPLESTVEQIRLKFKKKNFTAKDFRIKCFPSTSRPSLLQLSSFLDYLVSLNILEFKTIARKNKSTDCYQLKK